MPESDRRPPRFPFVAAALCAACLGAAAWTWMRYSYCWQMSPAELRYDSQWARGGDWPLDAYVSIRCRLLKWSPPRRSNAILPPPRRNKAILVAADVRYPRNRLRLVGDVPADLVDRAVIASDAAPSSFVSPARIRGRLRHTGLLEIGLIPLRLQVGASRLTGASIAGLVVGAMGVFVFAVALRHWLNQRKALRTPDTAAPPESGPRL